MTDPTPAQQVAVPEQGVRVEIDDGERLVQPAGGVPCRARPWGRRGEAPRGEDWVEVPRHVRGPEPEDADGEGDEDPGQYLPSPLAGATTRRVGGRSLSVPSPEGQGSASRIFLPVRMISPRNLAIPASSRQQEYPTCA